MLLQSPLHCPFLLHPKQYRQKVYLPSIKPKPFPSLNQLSYQRRYSNCRGKLTVTLEPLLAMRAALNLCQWELDLQVELSRHLNDAQFHVAMREAPACHSTTATALEEAYKSNIMALKWETKAVEGKECQAFAEAFWAVMWACPPEAQGTLNVSPPATHWQCATGSPHGNDNCGSATSHGKHNNYPRSHPTTGHNGWRTTINSLPTHSSKDTNTPIWNQMVAPFVWPGSSSFMSRRSRSGQSRHLPRRTSLLKMEREKAPCKTVQGELLGGLLPGFWGCKGGPASLPPVPEKHVCTRRVLWSCLHIPGDGLGDKPSEHQDVWGAEGLDWPARTEGCQLCYKASQRDIQFFHMVTPTKSPNFMGLKGIHSLQSSTWVRQLLPLPMVWEGGPEQRHSHK